MNMTGKIAPEVEVLRICGRRIGLLGGTFDPVHNGHLDLAAYVLNFLQLDSILFIPAPHPPHKGQARLTSFEHRLAMLKIAISGNPRFFVSDLEARRNGPSYSVDTLQELRTLLDPGVLLFFIIGMDAFVELDTWKNCRQLLDYADLAVVPRPGYPLDLTAQAIARLGRYVFDCGKSYWVAPDRLGRVYPVDMPDIAISSTDVRKKALAGASLAGLIPAPVSGYIAKHGLFGG